MRQTTRTRHARTVLGVSISALAASLALAGAPASAEPAGPNAISFGPVTCPATNTIYQDVVLPASQAKPGLVVGSSLVGVATSLWVAMPDGAPIVAIFDRPGAGLDALTVWCYWPSPVSPTGYIAGAILFNANNRPRFV